MRSAGFDRGRLDLLDPGWRDWLELHGEAGSTNDLAAGRARAGAPAGTVVAADRQVSGRGRKGAAWICPPGEGLAFSVVLRPGVPQMLWPRLALVAGLVVAIEIERLGLAARVKWPNDVLVRGRKVCGVLLEASGGFAVAGIGVNVNVGRFPDELAATATSLALEAGRPVEREPLLVGIRAGLLRRVEEVGDDFGRVLGELDERCALRGERVRATVPTGVVEGIMRGFGDGGELLIEHDGRVERLVQADEVRIL